MANKSVATGGRLGHLCGWLAGLAWDQPRCFLLAGLLLTVVAGIYSATHLRFMTNRNDMISGSKLVQQRWKAHLERMGSEDDLVVVVAGGDTIAQDALLADVESRLRAEPDHFCRVWREVDLRPLAPHSLLLLDTARIEAIVNELRAMRPLLDLPLGWNLFTLQNLVYETRNRLKGVAAELEEGRRRRAPGKAGAEIDAQVLFQLNHLLRCAAAVVSGKTTDGPLWQAMAAEDKRETMLRQPQRLRSDDGKLSFLLASPVEDTNDPMSPQLASVRRLRSILAEVGAKHDGLEIGLTGLPVLECDEMEASSQDSIRASWVAFLGVLALYAWAFRQWRPPVASALPLLMGTIWALGFATLTVGHLNLLSATFAVMLIGMGDYAVLLVSRYQRERPVDRVAARTAMIRASVAVGPSIITAAITGMLAFLATMLADFQAVAELGFIAGGGLALCALSAITMAPPLVSLLEKGQPTVSSIPPRDILPLIPREAPASWASAWAARPGLALGIGLAVWALLAVGAARVHYDANLLHLQAQDHPAVRWQHRLLASTRGASWHALVWADSRAEALDLKARLEALPEVSRITETASLLPDDQEHKAGLLAEIRQRLGRLPEVGVKLMHLRASPAALAREVDQLARQLREPVLADTPCQDPLLQACAQLTAAITAAGEKASGRLSSLDDRMAAELLTNLHRLRGVAGAGTIGLDDIPKDFRERHMDREGKFLLRVFAADELWEPGPLKHFIDTVSAVAPAATGKPYTTHEGLEGMRLGFMKAGVLALLAITLVLAMDLRSVHLVLLALAPLTGGLLAALGVMGWLGLALNPANLIALPLILGVGVDNGVHVLHDWLHRANPIKRYRLHAGTLQGILLAGATTVLGFGALALSGHQGLRSLGLLLAVGVASCMFSSLALLPALLRGVRLVAVHSTPLRLPQTQTATVARAG